MAHPKLKGKVYHPAVWKRLVAVLMFIIIPIQAAYLWRDFLQLNESLKGIILTIILAALIGIACWYAFEYAFRTYIFVTDEGIGVNGLHRGFITWDALEKFAWAGSLKNRIWGIRTIRSLDYQSGFWSGLLGGNFIPLSHVIGRPSPAKVEMLVMEIGVNLDKFAETPFGQDLLHYAPHLFEQSNTA
jgi:hypothetical protein